MITGGWRSILERKINMFGDLLTPTHLMAIFVVALLLFGAKRIPELGKGLCEGVLGFRDGIKGLTDSDQQTTRKI